LGSLKGKTTRTEPSKEVLNTCNKLPAGILEEHGDVNLAVDIMYINEIPFFMTTPGAIHFGMVELIKNEKISTIMVVLGQVIEAYEVRGFKIQHILSDRQFKHAQNI